MDVVFCAREVELFSDGELLHAEVFVAIDEHLSNFNKNGEPLTTIATGVGMGF